MTKEILNIIIEIEHICYGRIMKKHGFQAIKFVMSIRRKQITNNYSHEKIIQYFKTYNSKANYRVNECRFK